MRLVGTTKTTIQQIRDRTHWNSSQLQPLDPVTLGLCSQIDLDLEVKRSAKDRPAVAPEPSDDTLLPTDLSLATQPETTGKCFPRKRRAGARAGAGGRAVRCRFGFRQAQGSQARGRRRGRGQRSLTGPKNRRSATSDRAPCKTRKDPRRRSGAGLICRIASSLRTNRAPARVRAFRSHPEARASCRAFARFSSRASRIWPTRSAAMLISGRDPASCGASSDNCAQCEGQDTHQQRRRRPGEGLLASRLTTGLADPPACAAPSAATSASGACETASPRRNPALRGPDAHVRPA